MVYCPWGLSSHLAYMKYHTVLTGDHVQQVKVSVTRQHKIVDSYNLMYSGWPKVCHKIANTGKICEAYHYVKN